MNPKDLEKVSSILQKGEQVEQQLEDLIGSIRESVEQPEKSLKSLLSSVKSYIKEENINKKTKEEAEAILDKYSSTEVNEQETDQSEKNNTQEKNRRNKLVDGDRFSGLSTKHLLVGVGIAGSAGLMSGIGEGKGFFGKIGNGLKKARSRIKNTALVGGTILLLKTINDWSSANRADFFGRFSTEEKPGKSLKDKASDVISSLFGGKKDPEEELTDQEKQDLRDSQEFLEDVETKEDLGVKVGSIDENESSLIIDEQETTYSYIPGDLHLERNNDIVEQLGEEQTDRLLMFQEVTQIWATGTREYASRMNRLSGGFNFSTEQEGLINSSDQVLSKIQTLQQTYLQDVSEGKEIDQNALGETIGEVKNIILTIEDDREEIFDYKDMNSIFDDLSSYTYKNETSRRIMTAKLLNQMRSGMTRIDDGNSDIVARQLSDKLIAEDEGFEDIDIIIQEDGRIDKLKNDLDAKNTQGLETSIKSLLAGRNNKKIEEPTLSSYTKELSKKISDQYQELKIMYEKDDGKSLDGYFTQQFGEFRTDPQAQEKIIQEASQKTGKIYTSWTEAYTAMKDLYYETSLAGAILSTLRSEVVYIRVEANRSSITKKNSPYQYLYGSIKGVGAGLSDANYKAAFDVGINIGLCVLPLGAGIAASRVAVGLGRLALHALRSSSFLHKVTKLPGIVRYASTIKSASKLVLNGTGLYEGVNAANNFIAGKPISETFEGWDDLNGIVKSIAQVGIFKFLGPVIGKLGTKITPQTKVTADVFSVLKKLKRTGARKVVKTGALLGSEGIATVTIMDGIEFLVDGESDGWTRSELFQTILMAKLFQQKASKRKNPKDNSNQNTQQPAQNEGKASLTAKKVKGKILLFLKPMQENNCYSIVKNNKELTFNQKITFGKLFKNIETTLQTLPVGTTRQNFFGYKITKKQNGYSLSTPGQNSSISFKSEKELLAHISSKNIQGLSFAQAQLNLLQLTQQQMKKQITTLFGEPLQLSHKKSTYTVEIIKSEGGSLSYLFKKKNGEPFSPKSTADKAIMNNLDRQLMNRLNGKMNRILHKNKLQTQPKLAKALPGGRWENAFKRIKGQENNIQSGGSRNSILQNTKTRASEFQGSAKEYFQALAKDIPALANKRITDFTFGNFIEVIHSHGLYAPLHILGSKASSFKNASKPGKLLKTSSLLYTLYHIGTADSLPEGARDTLVYGILTKGLGAKVVADSLDGKFLN